MLSSKKYQLTQQNPQDSVLKLAKQAIVQFPQKFINSDLREIKREEKQIKLVKSQPELQQIYEGQQLVLTKDKKSGHSPRFIRSRQQVELKKKPIVNWKFLSPPARNNVLVHQPEVPKPKTQQKAFKTEIIPPSDLVHDKMKNFAQNPEKFLVNVDQGLDKLFKKSVESMVRTAKVVPVKDWQIRDSTNLLDGFTGNE